jgi:hypothetical protein
VNNRDNTAFRYLFGEHYHSDWPNRCMEGSFIQSGDIHYRPPRKLLVNEMNEANFFIKGPLMGTSGIY